MAGDDKTIWGIHAKDEQLFLKGSMIAIGWQAMGDLSKIDASREAFKVKYEETYPDAKKGSIATSAGMLYRFCYEAKPGDYVVFPSKFNREVNIGIIEGDYVYKPQTEFGNTRTVKWLKHLPRTAFSQGALYEIGSAMTFFSVKNYADEFMGALDKKAKNITSEEEDESIGATADDIIESTRDFILKELSRQLKGYALEDFVADLLRAMGYRTIVSPHGGDSGIDITAYKDEFRHASWFR